MNSKFYISCEAARLLKEKGYNEVTNAVWNGFSGEMRISPQNCGYSNLDYPDDMKLYSAPTKAEAIDWLESKGMVVDVRYDYDELQKDDSQWIYYIYQYDNEGQLDEMVSGWVIDGIYDTRLEAEEAAIIKALKLL